MAFSDEEKQHQSILDTLYSSARVINKRSDSIPGSCVWNDSEPKSAQRHGIEKSGKSRVLDTCGELRNRERASQKAYSAGNV